MRVIVAGAGQVGSNIARYLAKAGNDVTVIDQRAELMRKLGESLDIRAIVGFASHPRILEQAGAEEADLLIAVTHTDEVNMVACQVAHTIFNVPTKIARIRQQDYLEGRWRDLFRRDHVAIDVVISPEVEVAHAIALRLEVPGALAVVPFVDDKVRLVGVRCDATCPLLDTPLRQLTFLFPDLNLVIVTITRGGRLFVPDADDMILLGDEVHFVVDTAHLARALPAFGHEEAVAERVIVAGGGNIGLFLARELETRHPQMGLKLIEYIPERAEMIADSLARTVVLCGDARDRDLLDEANIRATSAIVTVTNDDEVNIMAALLAKHLGCQRAVALVNNSSYSVLLGDVGIDVVVNPRDTTVSSILQHVRRGRIRSIHTIRDGEAEVVEAEALDTSSLVGIPLRDAKLPQGVIVGAVVRGKQVLRPTGDTIVKTGDRVIMVARAEVVKRVEQLFAVRFDYF